MSSHPCQPRPEPPAKPRPDANALSACHQLLDSTALLLTRALVHAPSEPACECLAHLAACRDALEGIVAALDVTRAAR